MTVFYQDRECIIYNASEENFRELQKICEYSPGIKDMCRRGILVCFENSSEAIAPIEDLIFTQ